MALGKFAKMWNYTFNWDLSQDLACVGGSHQTAFGLRSEVLASHPILFTPVLCRWAVITLALPSWGEGSACGAKLQHCSVLQWGQGQCGRWWRWNPAPWSCPPLRPASHCLMYCPNQVLVRRLWGGGGAHLEPRPLLRCDVQSHKCMLIRQVAPLLS